jgi:hypothetical protein
MQAGMVFSSLCLHPEGQWTSQLLRHFAAAEHRKCIPLRRRKRTEKGRIGQKLKDFII